MFKGIFRIKSKQMLEVQADKSNEMYRSSYKIGNYDSERPLFNRKG